MTIAEAIEILEFRKDQPRPKRMSAAWRAEFDDYDRALDMAIKALKDQQDYDENTFQIILEDKGD